VLAQIVAEAMGVPLSRVRIVLGDSDLPRTPGSGGSFGAASSGGALYDACLNLRARLAALAVGDQRSPLHGASPDRVVFADQAISVDDRGERLDALVNRLAPQGVEADGRIAPGADYERFSQYAYGAHFAEVGVDMETGEVRLRRMLGVFAAGRLLNEKTARSQAIGGMIWGVGTALHEENAVDARFGSFVAQDLANYHVPVHADIPELDAVFLPEVDEHANPMGAKGVGELGICGAAAAIANAVHNASGVRLREYPITIDRLLPRLLKV
jgi:xanthine dehydrogenase YagR molybdenum-binding subunit